MKRICVFLGSNIGANGLYLKAAQDLGAELAGRGFGLVFGGTGAGLMEVLADAVLAAGGEAIGIIPRVFAKKGLHHQGLTMLHIVDTMHERKAMMEELAHGFVALPGGLGTMEEISEMVTWAQLGIHAKPCGLLNVNGYFDLYIRFLDYAVKEGFIRPEHRRMVLVAEDPAELLDIFEKYDPPRVGKWLDRESL